MRCRRFRPCSTGRCSRAAWMSYPETVTAVCCSVLHQNTPRHKEAFCVCFQPVDVYLDLPVATFAVSHRSVLARRAPVRIALAIAKEEDRRGTVSSRAEQAKSWDRVRGEAPRLLILPKGDIQIDAFYWLD
jgi:hypothetical protein